MKKNADHILAECGQIGISWNLIYECRNKVRQLLTTIASYDSLIGQLVKNSTLKLTLQKVSRDM